MTKYYANEEIKRELQTKIDGFETTMLSFNNALNVVKAIQQRAAFDIAIEDAIAAGKLTEEPSFIGMTSEEIAAEKERLRNLYLPNEDEMTDVEVAKYNVRVMKYINEKAKDPDNINYYGYGGYVKDLEDYFKLICGLLEKTSGSNPIGFYDELVSHIYNFDSQTYEFRLANRVTLQYNLINAIGVLAFHYQVAANPDSLRYQLIGTAFDNAMKSKIWTVSGHPASEIKANPHKATASEMNTYIGEIMVSGSETSAEEAKQYLIDAGYTVYNLDLNRGTIGCPIYLGYKTTNKFSEAISDFYLSQKHTETITVDGLGTGHLAPYTGDDYFKALYGNLNRGCGSKSKGIYLYYFKNTAETKTGVSQIHIYQNNYGAPLSVPYESGLNGRLNQGASGGYIQYLCVTGRQPEGVDPSKLNTVIETDAEYYPYCYTFGRKVSFYVSDYIGTNYEAEMKSAGNVMIWTNEEMNEFLARFRVNSLNKELRSAGVRLDQKYNGTSAQVYFLMTDYRMFNLKVKYILLVKTAILDDYKGRVYKHVQTDSSGMHYNDDYEHSAIYFLLH